MEGNRGGGPGLKRLPLNVIQPSKRCCINKEKRRRSRKGGKSGGRSWVSTYKPAVCEYVLCLRVHIPIWQGNPRATPASHIKGVVKKLQMHERMG